MACRHPLTIRILLVACTAWGNAHATWAQQVRLDAPIQSLSDGFSERLGPGIRFDLGGPSPSLRINWGAGQNSTRSLVSQTPSLTVTDGYPGYFAHGSVRPFVVGFTPVVGSAPWTYPQFGWGNSPTAYAAPNYQATSPVAERWNRLQTEPPTQGARSGVRQGSPTLDLERAGITPESARSPTILGLSNSGSSNSGLSNSGSSAERPDISVSEILRQRQIATSPKPAEYAKRLQRAENAEKLGKLRLAANYYRIARKHATDAQRRWLDQRIGDLSRRIAQAAIE